jgi:hypothetical protein
MPDIGVIEPASPASATLSAPSDEMSVSAVWGHLDVLRDMLGAKADVSASIWASPRNRNEVHVLLYPEGMTGNGGHHFIVAPCWSEALKRAYAWARPRRTILREAAIRRMALDIIDLTDAEGSCSAEALRRRGSFVAELVEAACQRANEISGNAPFVVTGA